MMKQHITSEQLNELSSKGNKKLSDWSFEHIQRTIKPLTPLLSIGQMLQFAHDKGYKGHWVLSFSSEDSIYELCDDLWVEIRYYLNNGKWEKLI